MSTPTLYTSEMLRQMKGQAVKDIWHSMIGKPAGIKNTTGLRNTEEIIAAILKGQQDPKFRTPKPNLERSVEETMPPKEKKNPGPKPKIPVTSPPATRISVSAIESTEIPLQPVQVVRRHFRKFHLEDQSYFLDVSTNELFSSVENKPGFLCGKWDPKLRKIHECDES